MKFYIDSNVFISYFNQDFGFKYQLQYPRVKEFFAMVSKEGHTLVLSPLTFSEVEKHSFSKPDELKEHLDNLCMHYTEIQECDEIKKKAEYFKNSGLHYPDNKHAAFAVYSQADCLVTWNIKHFKKISNIIPIKTPYELI